MNPRHKLVLRGAATALFAASVASCSDQVVPLQRFTSPDGVFTADYVKILYGGAAGGVTYCLNILDSDGSVLEDCALAAIHDPNVTFEWSGNELLACVDGGIVTSHTDAPIRARSGRLLRVKYRVAIAGRCSA